MTINDTNNWIDFGDVLRHLKLGKRARRSSWEHSSMFIFLVNGSTFTVNRAPLLGIFPPGTVIDYNPHIDVRMEDGTIAVWTATQVDILANDWMIESE